MGSKQVKMKKWRVLHLKHNHSYFESPKGGEHPSNYSQIICIAKGCLGNFRTKANYVYSLKSAKMND